MTERFTLNEEPARLWLAEQIDDGELSADYEPRGGDHDDDTGRIVYDMNLVPAVLSSPEGSEISMIIETDGYCSFRLALTTPRGRRLPSAMRLVSHFQELRKLGNADAAPGVDAALAVLQEAVDEANALLTELDTYVAARAGTS